MTSSIHLNYLLEQIPYFQGPFITSWLFFESYCALVIFNYSVVQGEYGLETLEGDTEKVEKVELEQGAEQFMLTEVQGKCRPRPRAQCWLKPVVKVKA